MAAKEGIKERIEAIAQESLDSFATIASKAREALADGFVRTTQISNNSFTNGDADLNLRRRREINRVGHETLSKEPAIARVTVEGENGGQQTYYFCKRGSLTGLGNIKLAILGSGLIN